MSKDNLMKSLPFLVDDISTAFKQAAKLNDPSSDPSGIIDPFDETYYIVYQSIMRVIGAKEIAESKDLCTKTLNLFELIEKGASPTRIIFPWLPTPAYIRRMTASLKLYETFSELVQDRKNNGIKGDDALQSLIDSGRNMSDIVGVSQIHLPLTKA